ncbi:hypothetical protein FN846DRAFT_974227, partial [Sphaerosporella brunnea]
RTSASCSRSMAFSSLLTFVVSSVPSPSTGGADGTGLGRLRGFCRRCKRSCFVGLILCGGIAELKWHQHRRRQSSTDECATGADVEAEQLKRDRAAT